MIPGVISSSIDGGQATQLFSATGLTNPWDKPFAISAIMFTGPSSISYTHGGQVYIVRAAPLDMTAVRIWAGGVELTRGNVPLSCLCPIIDRVSWGALSLAGSGAARSTYVWELPKTLILPPNTALQAQASVADYLAGAFGGTAHVLLAPTQMTLIGMVLDGKFDRKAPAAVPYACAWTSPVIASDALVASAPVTLAAQSPASAFANVTSGPLYVKNLINGSIGEYADGARKQYANADGLIGATGAGAGLNAQPEGWYQSPKYQIVRSGALNEQRKGTNFIVKDFAGSRALFYLPTREWRMNACLAPKEYFQVKAQGWIGAMAGPLQSYFQHRIGMTGYYVMPGTQLWR
jgi:hypothetical protein